MNTIAAVSTPRAAGGIAVIRISGTDAVKCAASVFRPFGGKAVADMDGYTCAYGSVYDKSDNKLDDAILTVFRAPHSYTGEDVCEISCHGGIFVTERILHAVYDSGASPASAGEFTKRAFLNGKLSLTQAEGVMDIISAEGNAAHRCAVTMRDGKLFKSISAVSKQLEAILGSCAAWIDYPEEDIEEVEPNNLIPELSSLADTLENILSTYNAGRIIKEGIDTCIAGKPNVGKSTVMNLLSGCERSIVTDIAGTTRDIVEESVRLGDVVLRLADTAGIHSTDDVVENAGVKRAVDRLNGAELVIAVFDGSQPLDSDDISMLDMLSAYSGKILPLVNKSDKGITADISVITEKLGVPVTISARSKDALSVLETAVKHIFSIDKLDLNSAVISNERQREACSSALSSLRTAMDSLKSGCTLDAVTVVLDDALNSLLELTGERATENVVAQVFSHFCVGK